MPGQPGLVVRWFRNILLGRSLESAPWVRRVDAVSPRSPPAVPNLPGGPAHKLADNYYYARDVRRAVTQPTIASTHQLLTGTLDEVTGDEMGYPQTATPPTPGSGHKWKRTSNSL